MEKIKELFHKHPYYFVGGVFLVVVLLWLWLRSGSKAAPATASDNGYYAAAAAAVNSGNQLQQAQAGYAAQTNQTTIAADEAKAIAETTAQVQQAGIAAAAEVAKVASNNNLTATSLISVMNQHIADLQNSQAQNTIALAAQKNGLDYAAEQNRIALLDAISGRGQVVNATVAA